MYAHSTRRPTRAARTVEPRANKYGAKCANCDGWVAAGAGTLSGSKGAWVTTHAGVCPPPRAAAANAEPGYYVRADGTAIVVIANRAKTRTYGKALRFPRDGGRPSWNYEPGLGISVADLKPMTAADAAEIGLSHGYCIKCCAPLGGETLSAAVSALIGYGETCAKNLGWPYPKGVVAQRAFIAERGR